jgi:hypothetical protein
MLIAGVLLVTRNANIFIRIFAALLVISTTSRGGDSPKEILLSSGTKGGMVVCVGALKTKAAYSSN